MSKINQFGGTEMTIRITEFVLEKAEETGRKIVSKVPQGL